MISKVTVFHRGGAVLWSSDDGGKSDGDQSTTTTATTDVGAVGTTLSPTDDAVNTTLSGETGSNSTSNSTYHAINKLIQSVLLSDKSASDSMVHDAFTLKWTFANNLNLVFVAVYFSFQKLLYVDDFLETVKNEFIKLFHESLKDGVLKMTPPDYAAFHAQYKRIQKYYKTQHRSVNKPRKWAETAQGQKQQQYKVQDSHRKNRDKTSQKAGGDDDDDAGDQSASSTKGFGRKKFGRKAQSAPRLFDGSKKTKSKSQKNVSKKNQGKQKNKGVKTSSLDVLGFQKKTVSQADLDMYDFTEKGTEVQTEGGGSGETEEQVFFTPDGDADLESSEASSDEDEEEDEVDDFSDLFVPNRASKDRQPTDKGDGVGGGSTTVNGGIWSRFSKLIGNKAIEESDISPALLELENSLSSKNVANVIAKELCDSVKKQLIGKEIGTFNTIRSVVKTSMTECLERILRPTRPINILHGIRTAKDEGRPYTIVFIGVNGVGKSTSLSKVIHYLKTRNLKVSVAACDTFRSGAVEQLKTHCRALNVRLFSQGYARDAAAVAYRAVQEAQKQKDDVVLVDTAGRMQNNAPLMRSLVALIQKNKPDLTLFVGEALVGNDGVDQLMEFNRALEVNNNRHLVDGIVLTKFDTVDDKVGAAISMTYKSRKPIVFIGTGQGYRDLKRMHVHTLIKKLLQ